MPLRILQQSAYPGALSGRFAVKNQAVIELYVGGQDDPYGFEIDGLSRCGSRLLGVVWKSPASKSQLTSLRPDRSGRDSGAGCEARLICLKFSPQNGPCNLNALANVLAGQFEAVGYLVGGQFISEPKN